jgi:hypothetical protein
LKTSLLPASTKVSVNADQSYKLIRLSLSESQLGIEVIGFIGQHLQVTGGSAVISISILVLKGALLYAEVAKYGASCNSSTARQSSSKAGFPEPTFTCWLT